MLVIDEPETHLHTLLAVRLWNALEDARPDVRFVYVTHDLTFALSRRSATYVIASPTAGLRTIALDSELPPDVSEALLGSASLSFYASRIVFCEGDLSSYDNRLYSAWFSGPDTVVRPVGGHQEVLRCVSALNDSGITTSLEVSGIVDGDNHSEAFVSSMRAGIAVLRVHEVESLFAFPAVVKSVAEHVQADFDEAGYADAIVQSVSEDQKRTIIIERWKANIEPRLLGIVSNAKKAIADLENAHDDVANIFTAANWAFKPHELLSIEEGRVSAALDERDIDSLMRIVPGKQLLPLAARTAGLAPDAYVGLILKALAGKPTADGIGALAVKLQDALTPLLPSRSVPVRVETPLA